VTILLAVAAGVAVLAASAAAWAGRWRGWTRTFITAHLPVPLTILPAFGLLLIAFGLHDAGPFPGSSALAGAALVTALVAAVLAVWNPPWFGPAWFRDLKTSGPVDPDLSDPLTASTYALSRTDVDARGPVAERFGDGPPLHAWRVSLVDGGARVGGHLELHRTGLAFYPNELEARMRQDPLAVVLESKDIAAVRVVSARAIEIEGPPGSVRRYEAFFPKRIAKEIEASVGPRRTPPD
jgi:hypothetical protein